VADGARVSLLLEFLQFRTRDIRLRSQVVVSNKDHKGLRPFSFVESWLGDPSAFWNFFVFDYFYFFAYIFLLFLKLSISFFP
jgi:hypothetical protein